jgi:hypothetical protein
VNVFGLLLALDIGIAVTTGVPVGPGEGDGLAVGIAGAGVFGASEGVCPGKCVPGGSVGRGCGVGIRGSGGPG